MLFAMTIIQTAIHAQDNTIPQAGNVGIGTTSPQVKLDVKGKVSIDSTLLVNDSVTIRRSLKVEEDVFLLGTAHLNQVIINGGLTSNAPALFNQQVQFSGIGTASGISGKNVILTDSAGHAQTVKADTLANLLKAHIYAEPVLVDFYCTEVAPVAPTWANGPYKLFSRCPDVNVGIGTPHPRVNLDVKGGAHVGKIAVNADPLAMGSKLFHLKAAYTHPSQSNHALFLIENHERPLFQVNNNGIARSREIVVDLQQAWPDYVFSPGYELIPLKDLASFIEQNGHLPNVPNAAQVAEEGIQLGEMNRILLEKVEELTLHLIEQQRLIEQQQQALEEQRQRIEALETN